MDETDDRSPVDRWIRLGFLLMLLLMVGGVVVGVVGEVRSQVRKYSPPDQAKAGESAKGGKTGPKPSYEAVGAEEAKVQVLVFLNYSNSCQWNNAHLTRAAAEALPDKIRVVYYNTEDADGSKQAKQYGVGCQAQLVVNGTKKLTALKAGKESQLELHGPIGEPSQLADVLRYQLQHEYGDEFSKSDAEALEGALKADVKPGDDGDDHKTCKIGEGCEKK